jgi:hypothetical protein
LRTSCMRVRKEGQAAVEGEAAVEEDMGKEWSGEKEGNRRRMSVQRLCRTHKRNEPRQLVSSDSIVGQQMQ